MGNEKRDVFIQNLVAFFLLEFKDRLAVFIFNFQDPDRLLPYTAGGKYTIRRRQLDKPELSTAERKRESEPVHIFSCRLKRMKPHVVCKLQHIFHADHTE